MPLKPHYLLVGEEQAAAVATRDRGQPDRAVRALVVVEVGEMFSARSGARGRDDARDMRRRFELVWLDEPCPYPCPQLDVASLKTAWRPAHCRDRFRLTVSAVPEAAGGLANIFMTRVYSVFKDEIGRTAICAR